MSIINFYKNYHLKESKTFCMLPWIHIHSSPSGKGSACCISESNSKNGIADTSTSTFMEILNSEKMIKLRKDMMLGIPNSECEKCYAHDDSNLQSSRVMMNSEFQEFYSEAMDYTNEDGTLNNFKMRYFDIRFSNICNFKCRTCGAGFSSQWEQEDLKNKVEYARVYDKGNSQLLLDQLMEQVPNLKTLYFAGGEPLITEEHYLVLEELIRIKKTDVFLRYNTNLSNFKFKDKDILSLWKHFEHKVSIYASIDHYGERAEYIRHGTDWGVVESNLHAVKKNRKFLNLQLNTVLSVFNFLTIGDFYEYLVDKKLYLPTDDPYTLYGMSTPEHFTTHILPTRHKLQGIENLEKAISSLSNKGFKQDAINNLKNAIPWATLYNTWEQRRVAFKKEIARIDKIRGEDFRKVFPELADLMDDKRIINI